MRGFLESLNKELISTKSPFPQTVFSSVARDALVQIDVISKSVRRYIHSATLKVTALLTMPAALVPAAVLCSTARRETL